MDLTKLTHASMRLRQMFKGRKLILGVGNLLKLKGFDLLLKAFAELAEDFAIWDLVIVGGGAESDNLKNLAKELKLCNRVHFTGPLPSPETMEWMDLCDIFCLPSWSEGFGVVYLEAMANGKPVIGVKGQGIDPVIRENETGLLVEPQNVQSVVNALRQLISNKPMRDEMGEKGKKTVLQKFTWEHCSQQYVQLYREILNK